MLEGLRVLEFEGVGPGPFASMMLADLGADVIVIHRAGGSGLPGKQVRPVLLDRGKRSIVLDLKNADDLETVRRLVARSDALIEGFRPGVMERLGLGPEALQAINPALVYGRMTGWGQSGPRAREAGHDYNYIALAGALHYASLPGQPPISPPTLVGDIGGGSLYLVIGILAGVMRARQTGKGTVVDAAIVDGAAHMMNLLMALEAVNGFSVRRGEGVLDGPPWSRTYRCADGRFLSVQCLEPQFYAIFLKMMGLDADPDFVDQMDRSRWPALCLRLEAIFAEKPQAEWVGLFDGSDACVSPVLAPDEAASDRHMAARGAWFTAGGALQAAPAPRFDDRRRVPGPVPQRGEHGADIRAWLDGEA